MNAGIADRSLLVVADDLTGACDAAGAITDVAGTVPVFLDTPAALAEPGIRAVDLDTRSRTAQRAAQATVAALTAALDRDGDVFLKIDSTLRGHVVPTVSAAAAAFRARVPSGRVVVCPAFPARGRVVRDGRVLVDGVAVVSRALRDLAGCPGVEVRDADTDADLAVIAGEARGPVLWVGAAGLARHVARARRGDDAATAERSRPASSTSVAVVVGTTSRASIAGAAELDRRGDSRVATVVGDPHDPTVIARAAAAAGNSDGLVVTGGFTARRLFEHLAWAGLDVHGEVAPGMPWASVRGGAVAAVTKAGGFGGPEMLVTAVDFLLAGA